MDLSAAEIKVILEMIQGAWASGSVRSPDMGGLLDSIKEKLEKKSDGGASK